MEYQTNHSRLMIESIDSSDQSLWGRHARHWQHVASPLRPCAADVALMQQEVTRLSATHLNMQVCLLGVTPELVALHLPKTASTIAIDCSAAMIHNHWQTRPRSMAILGQWEAIPLRASCIDLVLVDGGFNVLSEMDAIAKTLQQLANVIKSGGRMVMRTFVRPDRPERLSDVIYSILQGRIASVHAAKWRVAMALQPSLAHGVVLNDIWQAFRELADSYLQLSELTGWSVESIQTLEAYRGIDACYFFPTLTETRQLLSEHYDELSCQTLSYELAERCPTLVLRRR